MAFALVSLFLAAAPTSALQLLERQCRLSAADPAAPWALAHGVKTFGPSFLAADGRKATDVIIHDFLTVDRGDGGAARVLSFPVATALGAPLEPHHNLIVKALVREGQLPLATRFSSRFGPVTLGELVQSLTQTLRPAPGHPDYYRDLGWTLDVLAATQQPGARWQTLEGQTIEADALFDDALDELERETAELKAGLDGHLPMVPKRKQGLYAHACGGLHFVQGVLAWAHHPAVRKRWGARVDAQIAVHFYRLGSERPQYEAALAQAQRAAPALVLPVLVQELKFAGHFLETAARFRSDLGWRPDAAQQRTLDEAAQLLESAVQALDERHAFTRLEEFKRTNPQLALDLVGDTCHAARGLRAWAPR